MPQTDTLTVKGVGVEDGLDFDAEVAKILDTVRSDRNTMDFAYMIVLR